MPRRPLLTLAAIAVATSAAVAGCSDTIGLSTPDVSGADVAMCRGLLEKVPSSVAGQHTRSVAPSNAGRAWGDPAIVLQCGVRRPTSLAPTTRCDFIDDVGWLSEKHGSDRVFTTIGRSAYVRVTVPDRYQPAADALVDVATAIKATVPVVRNCV